MDLSIDLGSVFSDALIEIVSTVTGLKLNVTSDDIDLDFNEITGLMSISGKKSGLLFVTASENDWRILCTKMTGTDKADVTRDEAEDVACEFVNMTGGNAKIRLINTENAFEISQPIVVTSENMKLIAKRKTYVISKTLRCDDVTVKLKIVF